MNKPKGKNGIYFRNDGNDFGFYYYDADEDKFVWLSGKGDKDGDGGITGFDWDDFVSSNTFKNIGEMVFVCKTIEEFVRIMVRDSRPPPWGKYADKKINI